MKQNPRGSKRRTGPTGVEDVKYLRDYHSFFTRPTGPTLEKLSSTNTKDVQQIAATQIELLETYYQTSIEHANRSFFRAWVAVAIGTVFFTRFS